MSKPKYAERIEELESEIEDLQFDMAHVASIEAGCSSIVTNWIEVGGIRVGLDSVGSAVQVEVPESLYGWDVTQVWRDGEIR